VGDLEGKNKALTQNRSKGPSKVKIGNIMDGLDK
jgi:hypothetical protein